MCNAWLEIHFPGTETEGELIVRVPAFDLCCTGCFVNAPLPDPGRVFPALVKVYLDENTFLVATKDVEIEERYENDPESGDENAAGYSVCWKMDPAAEKKLHFKLPELSTGPSVEQRVEYIGEMNKLFNDEIVNIDARTQSRTRFLFTSLAAYFGFLAIPGTMLLPQINVLVSFYSILGIWLSVTLVLFFDRHLTFLSSVFRRKIFLLKSLSLHRSYVFSHDDVFYGKTLMPSGLYYDKKKSWSFVSFDSGEEFDLEKDPLPIKIWKFYPALFYGLIEFVLVIGAVFFVAVLTRSLQLGSEHHLPKYRYFAKVFGYDAEGMTLGLALTSPIVLFWMQAKTNGWLAYYRKRKEAALIKLARPNPVLFGEGLRSLISRKWTTAILALPAIASMLAALLHVIDCFGTLPGFVPSIEWARLMRYCMGAFFVLKLAYIVLSLKADILAQDWLRIGNE